MSNVTIRAVRPIVTAPSGVNLVVVKVETSEAGLYGLGCATFTQRYETVVTAVRSLESRLLGRAVEDIEDAWQVMAGCSYWRNGPVLNNAISGVDQALWDIKGKMAGMPVYSLLGGKCRPAAAVYRHADGGTLEEVEENVCRYMEEGYHHIRCQMGTYGGQMRKGKQTIVSPEGVKQGHYYDPAQYMRSVVKLFDHLRAKIGFEVELIHDVHERLAPADTIRLATELDPFKLFFLEDALPPDQVEWLRLLRQKTNTPLAMGELFNNPMEWKKMISEYLIDYIRVHISQIGGLTPARKLAAFCEAYGVRTAWHGPSDISPVGAMAQLHLDLTVPNFGIQEVNGLTDTDHEVFSGCPEIKKGYLYPNDKPGFGVDIDEKKAEKYPAVARDESWLFPRLPDGTAVRP